MLVQVDEQQLIELLAQNKEMKEDIYLLLSSVNYFTEFLPKDLGNTGEAPSLPMLMIKMGPVVKQFMEQMKSPQMQFTIETLKNIHAKYVSKIQPATQQIETGAKAITTGNNGNPDGELTKQ